MNLKKRVRPMIVLAAVAAAGAIVASAAPTTPAAEDDPRICCLANPRFAGICAVDLAPEETCADVLKYLNNAASVGKTYCGNTTVRMGWKQVECQKEETSSDDSLWRDEP